MVLRKVLDTIFVRYGSASCKAGAFATLGARWQPEMTAEPEGSEVEDRPTATSDAASAPHPGAGLASLVGAALLFSWGFPLVKLLALPGAVIASARLVIGAAALSLAAPLLRTPWPRRWGAVVAAGVFFGLHQLLYIAATKRTAIAIVAVVGALQPLVIAAVSRRAVGERVPRSHAVCAAIATCGVALVVGGSYHDQSRSLVGDGIAVVNLLSYVGYFLATKRARQEGAPTLTLTAAALGIAALVTLPVMAFGELPPPRPWQWAYLALLALGPGNGHLLVNWAHRHVSAGFASLVLSAAPLLASVWAALLFGEAFGWLHVVGMALVVAAIEGARRSARHGARAA